MFLSIRKICVLLLCFAGFEPLNGKKREKCKDCVPILECEEATQYRTNQTDENIKFVTQNYCGLSYSFHVCCSKFKTNGVTELPNPEPQPDKTEHPNLKLLPDSCGHIHNTITFRIIAGSFAALYEFPWMVLISYGIGDDVRFGCSGTLINSRYVLTAAHCVQNLNIAGVRVGEYHIGVHPDCEDNVCESNLQDISVEQEIMHENYSKKNNFINDIALLRLANNVNMRFKNAATICLPITKELQESTITNKYAKVAGWGITEHGRDSSVLLKVILPVRSNDECKQFYSHVPDTESTQFCAGKFQKDSCRGDSGGPLMIEDMYKGTDKFVQYGIVSNGPSKCGSHTPGIYTDVRKYMKWILDNIKA